MYKNKKATILIYILVLISIVMIMAIVVLNNSVMLDNSFNYQTIKSELSAKIKEKGDMFARYDILMNSDGGGFEDIIGCPNDITMSGETIFSSGVYTERSNSGDIFTCSGSYNSQVLNIVFTNTGYNSFSTATLGTNIALLAGGTGNLSGYFSSYDSGTTITIPSSSYNRSDGCDDDFNNDNYNGSSGCDY